MARNKGMSPMTKAPAKPTRFLYRNSIVPTWHEFPDPVRQRHFLGAHLFEQQLILDVPRNAHVDRPGFRQRITFHRFQFGKPRIPYLNLCIRHQAHHLLSLA